MEDLLLLLLGLIWLGASYFQSQRKKKAEEERRKARVANIDEQNYSEDEEPSEKESLLEKMLETINEEGSGLLQDLNKQQSNQLSNEEINDIKEKGPDNKEEEKLEHGHESEESLTASPGLTAGLARKKQTKKRHWAKNLTKDFDGKKAVIYSEILNRPY